MINSNKNNIIFEFISLHFSESKIDNTCSNEEYIFSNLLLPSFSPIFVNYFF